jgi:hypothetical protein
MCQARSRVERVSDTAAAATCGQRQKGLAIGADWSGSCRHSGRQGRSRDPAPPARAPRWGFGGAADAAMTERRISMSKSGKKQSPSTAPSTVAAAKPSQQTQEADAGSKQSHVIAMLQSPKGATIAAMMEATGWQPHSVRGFLAGVVRKRLKLKLASKKLDGNRVYQIARPADGSRQSRRRSA